MPLTTLEACPQLDVTIDGADEVVLQTLDAIKGLGGALLREIAAEASLSGTHSPANKPVSASPG